MDIVIDEVDDAEKIQLLGPEFKEAGIALQDISSVDDSVEQAISEMGATFVEFGNLLANGKGIFSEEVKAVTDKAQLKGIDAEAVCASY